MAADFGNIGRTGIATVDPNGLWYIRANPSSGNADTPAFPFGVGSWQPIAGRWTPANGGRPADTGLGGNQAQMNSIVNAMLAGPKKAPDNVAVLDSIFSSGSLS